MARVKPSLATASIATLDDADAALARIAALKTQISLEELALKEGVDALKAKCAAACEQPRAAVAALEQALMAFALARKGELFANPKSRNLLFGSLGFRASSSLKPVPKMTWERVLGVLKEKGMASCIRLREEVDREALRRLDAATLAGVGCRLIQEDAFFYELNDIEIEIAADGDGRRAL